MGRKSGLVRRKHTYQVSIFPFPSPNLFLSLPEYTSHRLEEDALSEPESATRLEEAADVGHLRRKEKKNQEKETKKKSQRKINR